MNITQFKKAKIENKKISMLTVYDSTYAAILEKSNVDAVLIGDSAAMVMHGYSNTTHATTQMIADHVRAVASQVRTKLIVADMPFLSFRRSRDQVLNDVDLLVKAGAQALKVEGADGNLEIIQHIVESGVPVMGHLGLTPQFIHQFGGYKVQGKETEAQEKMIRDALALHRAGCFSLVLECVPSPLAKKITEQIEIPTIGIGAGVDTDGQILVLQDLLGLNPNFKPKFVRTYLDGFQLSMTAINQYVSDTKDKSFPSVNEGFE